MNGSSVRPTKKTLKWKSRKFDFFPKGLRSSETVYFGCPWSVLGGVIRSMGILFVSQCLRGMEITKSGREETKSGISFASVELHRVNRVK